MNDKCFTTFKNINSLKRGFVNTSAGQTFGGRGRGQITDLKSMCNLKAQNLLNSPARSPSGDSVIYTRMQQAQPLVRWKKQERCPLKAPMVPRPDHAARTQRPPRSSSGELEPPLRPLQAHTQGGPRPPAPLLPRGPATGAPHTHNLPEPRGASPMGTWHPDRARAPPQAHPSGLTFPSQTPKVISQLPGRQPGGLQPRPRKVIAAPQPHRPTGATPGPQLGPPAQLHPQQEDAQEGAVRASGQRAARERQGNRTPRKGRARDRRRGPGGIRGAAQKQLWGVVEGARWGRGALASEVRLPKVGHGGAGPRQGRTPRGGKGALLARDAQRRAPGHPPALGQRPETGCHGSASLPLTGPRVATHLGSRRRKEPNCHTSPASRYRSSHRRRHV